MSTEDELLGAQTLHRQLCSLDTEMPACPRSTPSPAQALTGRAEGEARLLQKGPVWRHHEEAPGRGKRSNGDESVSLSPCSSFLPPPSSVAWTPSSLQLEGPGAREEEQSRKPESALGREARWLSPAPACPGLLAGAGRLGVEGPGGRGVSASLSKSPEVRLTENGTSPPLTQGLLSRLEDGVGGKEAGWKGSSGPGQSHT